MKIFTLAVAIVSQLFFNRSSVSAQSIAAGDDHYLDHLLNTSMVLDTTGFDLLDDATDSLTGWRQWHTVENFYFGKDRGSMPMIADIQALHPYFRDKISALISTCKTAGIDLAIVESYRTPAKQAEYYAMGRKYTNSRGGKSRHQYGLAVDVVPIVGGVAVWDDARLWRKIGIIGERLGLRWGGRWRVTYDPGHFEWSGGLSSYELAKGYLPEIPSSEAARYADIHNDMQRLQAWWDAWQIEQSLLANKGTEHGNADPAMGIGN